MNQVHPGALPKANPPVRFRMRAATRKLAPHPLASAVAVALAAWSAAASAAGPATNAAWIAQQAGKQATANAARIGAMTPYGATLTAQQVQQINEQTRLSIANLGQAAQAAAAAMEAQRKAREAALLASGGVPDGLGTGGLSVDTNPATAGWSGADKPTQAIDPATGRILVGIRQTADRAILNWETFNIGRNTSLQFDQQSTWAVLNRVNDPSSRPSQILGRMSGAGTIMVLNRNGVLFSGSSQVDTGNLVAAAARMSDAQFRDNGIYSAAAGAGGFTPSFTDAGGKLIVEGGAIINTRAPQSVTEGGGYALLLGSEVRNGGTINTPRGQAELAAGDSFILRPGYSSDGNQVSTTRGNEVAVQRAAASAAGLVSNSGVITAGRGDITLAGHDVRQEGVALATTSVSQRGTIHLLNSATDADGKVTLAAGSVTSVLIEDSTETALDSQRDALLKDSADQDKARADANAIPAAFDNLSRLPDRRDQSRVEITSGGTVNFENQSLTLATGGQIAVSAAGRAFVADGARLDAAGAPAVKVAMESNSLKISVQGNEQRDAPGSRDRGSLNSNDVWVDVRDLVLMPAGTGGYATDRYYTPGGLLEVSGYLGTTGHTIGEWAAVGGSVRLAGKEVVTQKGSSINLAGGSIVTADGFVRTSWLRGSDGLLYTAGNAPGDQLYDGVYNGYENDYARWGVTDRFYNVALAPVYRWQKGFVTGRDGGALIVDAPTAILEGDVNAGVLQGERQGRQRDPAATDGYKATQNTVARAAQFAFGHYQNDAALPTQPQVDVRFGNGQPSVTGGMMADGALPDARAGTAWFDAAKFSGFGFGGIEVYSGSSILVDGALTLADGGHLRFVAPDITVNANLTARAGGIRLGNTIAASGTFNDTVLGIDGKARIDIGAGAVFDVRGKWVNALLDGSEAGALAYVDGGSVDIESTHDVTIAAGSRIDASSGGAVLTDRSLRGGRGGAISLTANGPGANAPGMVADPAATLRLYGEVRAYGAGQGGTLSISAGTVRIGGGQAGAGELVLPESLFASGFSNYDINGLRSMTVADGTHIDVVPVVYRLDGNARYVPTGTDPAVAMPAWLPPLYQENPVTAVLGQREGASLTLRSAAIYDSNGAYLGGGNVTVGSGSSITVDPGQTIRVDGKEQVVVDGTLTAPGGRIIVVNSRAPGGGKADATPGDLAVLIGGNARLDAAARAVTALDQYGRAYGVVPDGGSIVLGSEGGTTSDDTHSPISTDAFVIVRPGAVLDVSGASAALSTGAAVSPLDPLFRATYDAASAGGSIAVRSYSGFTLEGEMRAAGGGPGARGGLLALELQAPLYPQAGRPFTVPDAIRIPRELWVSQHDLDIVPYTFGTGAVSVDRIRAGGFDDLSLVSVGAVGFRGDVDLSTGQSLRINAGWLDAANLAGGGDGVPSSHVRLAAPYVSLGAAPLATVTSAFQTYPVVRPQTAVQPPQASDAGLRIEADLIDVGTLDLTGAAGIIDFNGGGTHTVAHAGFGTADLESRGDIRLQGALRGHRELTLGAAQIYPVTLAVASLFASERIALHRTTADMPGQPKSVFGSLSIAAPEIEQGAVLRAPLGKLSIGVGDDAPTTPTSFVTDTVAFLPGSLTSVSADGLSVPFGGTADGITYGYNGVDVSGTDANGLAQRLAASGVTVNGRHSAVQAGATLDLSGGGELLGAAFVSGRGGSVDVLQTALANASPANTFSSAGNAVYAIVPGIQPAYAPVDAGAGTAPGMGRQITIPAGVPGLPAGTYTLMPARYALMPGAFRVELGGMADLRQQGVVAMKNGSFAVAAAQGVANTGARDAQATRAILTSGDVVRRYAQYGETSYADFARQNAATFGNPAPPLPEDGKTLTLRLSRPDGAGLAFGFAGNARFGAAEGGNPGSVSIDGATQTGIPIEILAAGAAPSAGYASFRDGDLNALDAPRLSIGGTMVRQAGGLFVINSNTSAAVLRGGAVLQAPEVFLAAGPGGITLESGSRLDTVGQGSATPYRSADGYLYSLGNYGGSQGMSLLAVSNNWLDVTVPNSGSLTNGGIHLGDARLYTEGSLVLALKGAGALTMDDGMRFGARELSLAVSSINIGGGAALAAAARDRVLPDGLQFDQALMNRLLTGNDEPGVPALESLRLGASDSINFFGTVDLSTLDPATGKSRLRELVLSTPAIYGLGGADDKATLTAGRLVWTGLSDGVAYTISSQASSALPGVVLPGGAGTGRGTLSLVADDIVLGYASNAAPDTRLVLDRLALGFSTVNLTAAGSIAGNYHGTLSAYQSQGAYVAGQGYTYGGGDLNLNTPLLTGGAGSVAKFVAGGAIVAAPLPGQAAPAEGSGALGAEIDLKGDSVVLATRVALPSGRLVVNAQRDITLTDAAQLDLAGRGKAFFEQTRSTPGGDVVLESTTGNITQAAGSRIDVSAPHAAGGTVQATATGDAGGRVALAGRIDGGGADDPAQAGGIDIRARVLDDFTGLNQRLNEGGVVGSRSFVLKQGDMVVGDEVRAHAVTISVDGGSLTVTGKVDASGLAPGSIRLAARDNLTLAGAALLDAHSTRLAVDSYGQPIDAANRATVELSAANGMLTLAPGAAVDMRSADAVARGRLVLDAGRAGSATANDVRVDVSGPVRIDGAASIAVQGFWRYDNAPADPEPTLDGRTNQIITQAWLDTLNQDSQAFMQGAAGNASLQGRLAGLRAYGDAYHLRPGVEIVSSTANGNLTVQGDIDLSGYRYGPNATAVRGSGEPGALVIRAGGDLDIFGSISDGFAPPPATPDDANWKLASGIDPMRGELVLPVAITLKGGATGTATSFSGIASALDFPISVRATSLKANVTIPTRITLNAAATLPAGTVLRAAVRDATGNVLYPAGTVLTQAASIPRNAQFDAGSIVPVTLQVAAFTVPAGVSLSIFSGVATLAANVRVPSGTRLPPGVNLQFADAAGTGTVAGIDLRPVAGGRQGSLWAIAPMLAAGSDSWSMRLAGGADTQSADTRTLQAAGVLGGAGDIRLSDPHFTLVKAATRQPVFSVIRTGTGDLDMLAGGDFSQATPFGIYTAGTQAAGIGPNGADPYNLRRGINDGSGMVLGSGAGAAYEALTGNGNYQAWYPERGGDVVIAAQGNLSGDIFGSQSPASPLAGLAGSNLIGNWLWRQGGDGIGQPAAWWINFGTYAVPYRDVLAGASAQVIGFTGIGALGGGNVAVDVGGNAGVISDRGNSALPRSSGLNIAIGGSGRVSSDGTIAQTGGGNLDIRVGGAFNPAGVLSPGASTPDMFGSLVNLRGDTALTAGAIGYLAGAPSLSQPADPNDPRWQGAADNSLRRPQIGGGLLVAPGDGGVSLSTRGDLVLDAAADPGRSYLASPMPFRYQGLDYAGNAYSWFTLWTDRSAIALFSSGGNVTPSQQSSHPATGLLTNSLSTDGSYVYPPGLSVTAASGSIFYGGGGTASRSLVLAPSPLGKLEFLAADSIRGQGYPVDISGADPAALPTPRHPAYEAAAGDTSLSNVTGEGGATQGGERRNWLFTYQADTAAGGLFDGPTPPARFYAVEGDIVGLRTGEILNFNAVTAPPALRGQTWYVGSRPVWIQAGRDIVGAGTAPGVATASARGGAQGQSSGNLFVHNDPRDISVVAAGRDILQSSFDVAGPGLLEVSAGRNLYQGDKGSLESLGAIVNVDPGNRSGGASIVALAGVGASGPDYAAFARRYFSAGNAANPAAGLDDAANAGKVARTYENELAAWLAARYGYAGGPADALAAFLALSAAEQGIFAREVYFAELRTSGREFNDPGSRRAGSYARGRAAIATLFPDHDAQDNAIAYGGDITLFGPSGIRTDFGGSIETLTPGGRTLIGVEGKVPPPSSGLLTQGSGDINMYARDSILLGLSRIFTTFGGGITAWSATGDINAGRGAKTTVLFSPPRRLYDDVGNVTLSPTVPSTGAGIATLNPIPEIPPGDIDLIAPLGTIDAGEAGIRVSGNVNLAALQVVNAANVQVQGKATGLPALASVNVGALTSASAAASAVTQAAEDLARQQATNARDRMPSVVSVQVLGFGDAGQ